MKIPATVRQLAGESAERFVTHLGQTVHHFYLSSAELDRLRAAFKAGYLVSFAHAVTAIQDAPGASEAITLRYAPDACVTCGGSGVYEGDIECPDCDGKGVFA